MVVFKRRILRTEPMTKLFYEGLDWQALQKMTGEEQERFLKSLSEFPRLICRSSPVLVTLFSLPAGVFMVLTWEPTGSMSWHILKVIAVLFLTRVYGMGCAFIDGSRIISHMREDIRARLSWTVAFQRERALRPSLMVEWIDFAVIATLFAFYTFAAFTILAEASLEGGLGIVAFQMATCLILAVRFQYLVRQYRSLFWNSVIHRLDEKERELSTWVLDHAERQRLKTFAEVAGIVVHDLANPVHTIAFCAGALSENRDLSKRDHYLEIISKNSEKVSGLIKSLRTYLKKGRVGQHVRLVTIHESVVDFLSSQYATKSFHRMIFDWDQALDEVVIQMMPNEIMHILLNIYANAVKNLVDHNIVEPCLRISLVKREGDFMTFAVADNGTGLSPEGFQSLLAFGFMATPQGRREGFGLRLGARILEQHGGALYLDEAYYEERRGTRLLLSVPGGSRSQAEPAREPTSAET